MNTFIKSAFVALSLAVAGVGATASTASAKDASFTLVIGGGGYHKGYHGHGHRWDRGHRGGHRWDRGHGRRGQCSAGKALHKASRMGLRRARIVDVNHRVVKVSGKRHGHRVRAVFANTWRCPVVAVR